MRQVVLDTETTGLETELGHRIIEIGALEILDRQLTGNKLHYYLNPERAIDAGALEVHGLTSEFLADKPLFAGIACEFLEFIDGAELVIHNAAFDIGFLDYELSMADPGLGGVEDRARILDTLELARELHPGQRNNLDALCKRYSIDNSNRTVHGALLDAQLLAEVYLAMTGGQSSLGLQLTEDHVRTGEQQWDVADAEVALTVLRASHEEMDQHAQRLEQIDKISDGNCLWLQMGDN
jgi:DNA polymerase-3 subunit epsilon